MTWTSWKRMGLVVVVAAMAGVAACGGGTDEPEPEPPTLPPTLPPQQADAGTNPADAGTQPSAQRGQAVFAEHCNVCHPGGQAGVGPSLIASTQPPERMRQIIRTGGGGMPPFPPSVIPDPELEDLIAYLLQIRTQ